MDCWEELDHEGTGFIDPHSLTTLLLSVDPPLGVKGRTEHVSKTIQEILQATDIPIRHVPLPIRVIAIHFQTSRVSSLASHSNLYCAVLLQLTCLTKLSLIALRTRANGTVGVHFIEALHALVGLVSRPEEKLPPEAQEFTIHDKLVSRLPKDDVPTRYSAGDYYAALYVKASIRGFLKRAEIAKLVERMSTGGLKGAGSDALTGSDASYSALGPVKKEDHASPRLPTPPVQCPRPRDGDGSGDGEPHTASPSMVAAAGVSPWPSVIPFEGTREVSIFTAAGESPAAAATAGTAGDMHQSYSALDMHPVASSLSMVAAVGVSPHPSSSTLGVRAVSRFSPSELSADPAAADHAASVFGGTGPSSTGGNDGEPQPQPFATAGPGVATEAEPSPTVAISDGSREADVPPETLGAVLAGYAAGGSIEGRI